MRPLHLNALGTLSAADILTYVQDPTAATWLSQPLLVDARQASFDLSSTEVHRLVSAVETLSRNILLGRTAVVTSGDLYYGVVRMYSILAAEFHPGFRVFRCLDEAEQWVSYSHSAH